MFFDPEAGSCVFEVILGFDVDGKTRLSGPCLIQADDPDEAEEKVMEILDDLDLEGEYWIEEMSEPYDIEEYRQHVEDKEKIRYPLLDEMTEDEMRDFMGL